MNIPPEMLHSPYHDTPEAFKNFRQVPAKGDGESFFEYEANDYRDVPIDFEEFEGYVTLVVPLKSQDCNSVNHILDKIDHIRSVYPFTVEIVLVPYTSPSFDPIKNCPNVMNKYARRPLGQGHALVTESVMTYKDNENANPSNPHPVVGHLRQQFRNDDRSYTDEMADRVYAYLVTPNGDLEMHFHEETLQQVVATHMRQDFMKESFI